MKLAFSFTDKKIVEIPNILLLSVINTVRRSQI